MKGQNRFWSLPMNPHLKGFILAWPLVGALGWILHFLT